MLKMCFLTNNCIFSPKSQNAQHVNMYALASFRFGFRRSKISRNDKKFSAYPKTMCWWNFSRLWEIQVTWHDRYDIKYSHFMLCALWMCRHKAIKPNTLLHHFYAWCLFILICSAYLYWIELFIDPTAAPKTEQKLAFSAPERKVNYTKTVFPNLAKKKKKNHIALVLFRLNPCACWLLKFRLLALDWYRLCDQAKWVTTRKYCF